MARYRVTFEATWTAASHPADPPPNPHFSPLIGGPRNGATGASGVAVTMEDLDLGRTLAHEIGHYLGLDHTVEPPTGEEKLVDFFVNAPLSDWLVSLFGEGLIDLFGDTPECGRESGVPDPLCTPNVMYWAPSVSPGISPGQGRVMRAHPLVRER